MKKCANCGFESPDDAVSCPACGTDTFIGSSSAIGGQIISPEEQRFWERMTFRQFAVLIIRIQAVWFLFYAVDVATYLPTYLSRLRDIFSLAPAYAVVRHAFFWALFRLIWHLAGAVVCVRYADRIVSWLVRDLIPRPVPGVAREPKDPAP